MQCIVVCWLVIMCLALLHSKVQCAEQAEILQKLAYIDEKLDKVLNLLNDRTVSIERPTTSSNPDDTSGTSVTEPLPPLELLETRWEMVGESSRFTVQYKTELDHLNVKWIDRMTDKTETGSEVRISENVLETSYTQNKDFPYAQLDVMMELPTVDTAILLYFRGDREQFVVKEGVELPFIDIITDDGRSELVYDEGNNVTFKIRTSANKEKHYYEIWGFLMDLETGTLSSGTLEDWQYDVLDQKNESSGTVATLSLNMAKNTTAGYLMFIDGVGLSDRFYTRVNKGIELGPSSAESTFPPDFLQFAPIGNSDFRDLSSDTQGNEQKLCLKDRPCEITCLAVGYDIVDLSLRKVSSDGELGTSVNATEANYFRMNFLLKRGFVFYVEEISDGELYACVVKNSRGYEAQKRFVITYAALPMIDRSRSVITMSSDEDAQLVELTISCIVNGYPKPEVNFFLDTISDPGSYYQPDLMVQIGDSSDNVYNATKVVTYDPDTLPAYENSGLRSASCWAKMPYNNSYDGIYTNEFFRYNISSTVFDNGFYPLNFTYYNYG